MRKPITAFLAFALFLLAPVTGHSDEAYWQTVKSDACGGFTVKMPGTPKEESANEKDIIMRTYSVDEWPEGIFTVACIVYLPGTKVDATRELSANRDNFNNEAEAKPVSETAITRKAFPESISLRKVKCMEPALSASGAERRAAEKGPLRMRCLGR
jgi:hypothetical protein